MWAGKGPSAECGEQEKERKKKKEKEKNRGDNSSASGSPKSGEGGLAHPSHKPENKR